MEFALAIVLGFAAGVLAGLFGVGGGILFVPTLTLTLGLSQLHAQATSLLAILPTGCRRRLAAAALRQRALARRRSFSGWRESSVWSEAVSRPSRSPSMRCDVCSALLMLATAGQIVWRVWSQR